MKMLRGTLKGRDSRSVDFDFADSPIGRVYERAVELHAKARVSWREPGISMPFGVPDPESWHWRVSPDIERALRDDASRLYGSAVLVGVITLLGVRLDVDEKLPPNGMLLERVR